LKTKDLKFRSNCSRYSKLFDIMNGVEVAHYSNPMDAALEAKF
jgi:hypothetical protein